MADAVMLFLDYQNAHFTARERFHPYGHTPDRGHIDPAAVGRLLVSRRRRGGELTGVRVYRGRPVPDYQAGAAAANDRQTAAWERDQLVDVIRRPLRYPRDWPTTPAREKGVDVQLAVDLVRLGIEKAYDVAIVFSRDTDLLPALETIRDLKIAHVELAGWAGTTRMRFSGTNLPWCHFLDEADYLSVADQTDYTR